MIPELGLYSLIIACILAICTCLIPFLIKRFKPNFVNNTISLVIPLCIEQTFFVVLGFIALLYAFLNNDFSVWYVSEHSHTALPVVYKMGAIWGGHEGSLLLWVLILSFWILIVTLTSKQIQSQIRLKILIILSAIQAMFLLFLLLTSNPFLRLLPTYPFQGNDLNPILQDIGMMLHPPLLYMGYVGFVVPFAFAIAILWQRECPIEYFRWLKRFILWSFSFLGLGITLGSFWAYYELGWGGFWFWDPVENASLMPWLVSIGLIHNLLITIKRAKSIGFTLLLCITAFSFSLLGTFLVRSSVLSSVHSFASDPKRGLFLLMILAVIILFGFGFWGLNIYKLRIKDNENGDFIYGDFTSRESFLFANAILMLVLTATVLLGTLFPLLYEMFFNAKISVGFPYFNAVFIPLAFPVLFLIPLGTSAQWQGNSLSILWNKMKKPFWVTMIVSVICTIILYMYFNVGEGEGEGERLYFEDIAQILWTLLGVFITLWIIFGSILPKMQNPHYFLKHPGVMLAHLGVAVLVIGITVVTEYQEERQLQIKPKDTISFHKEKVTFLGTKTVEGKNYVGYVGSFKITNAGVEDANSAYIYPEKRFFVARGITMTETALSPGIFRDIYIAMGEQLQDDSWSLRIYYKPFVRFIWIGGIMMALGGLLSAVKRKKIAA